MIKFLIFCFIVSFGYFGNVMIGDYSAVRSDQNELADPNNATSTELGKKVYDQHCASCHGGNLEGQESWWIRNSEGKLPAPPHDETGHTWHHSDAVLFKLTKDGIQSIAGPDYPTDMIAYADVLSDEEIWAVIAFIKSTWHKEIQEIQKNAQ